MIRRMGAPRKADKLTEPSSAELRAIREGRADLRAGRYLDHPDFGVRARAWARKPKTRRPPAKA
ncbi:MAG: hypothetical protein IT564_08825 [Rhodospirillales bacterium]|nr:hypothetical protein [Rhodospirillales bacterium]